MISKPLSPIAGCSTNDLAENLRKDGVALIPGFTAPNEPLDDCKQKFLDLCAAVGQPIGHDRHDKIIWDIKSTPVTAADGAGVITYSQHSHEADLHTDSQYSSYPEDYFGLLTLRKARCGGGISYLLSLKDILEELDASINGRAVRRVLEETDFPFIIPTVFKQEKSDRPEFNFGPILRPSEIRFRVDTIQKALEYDACLCSQEQIRAFEYMVELVRNTECRKTFFLEDGDLILINNKTMLHGRGGFTDHDRHLLRIRMNKYERAKA